MHIFPSFLTLFLFIQHITAKKVMLFPDFTVNKPPLKHLPKKTFFIRFLFMCIIRQNFLNFNLLKALVDTFLLKLPQFVLIIQKLAKRRNAEKEKMFLNLHFLFALMKCSISTRNYISKNNFEKDYIQTNVLST